VESTLQSSELRGKASLDLGELECRLRLVVDKENPSTEERDCLWRIAVELLNEAVADGYDEAKAKVEIARCFDRFAVRLAKNQAAFIHNLERKLQRWDQTGSVSDLRMEANKAKRAPGLSQEDRDKIVQCAIFKKGGRLDLAWEECLRAKTLSAELIARYPIGRKRVRSPKPIRRQLAAEIKRLNKQHIRPRHARLNGPYITRDWSGVFSNDWHSSDDITLPVYFGAEGTLTRGQFLPMIDVKSKRILDFVLIELKSYNAPTIRSLITRVCMKHGLPNKGWHFERGIWKDSKLIGGGEHVPGWAEVQNTFATRLGRRIMHALPGNARAKVVENVAGLLQNLMEGEPGYVGRDEQNVKYERVQKAKKEVEAGGKTYREAGFYSRAEWMFRLHEIAQEYNSRPQDSIVMGGRFSPDEAWEKFQERDSKGEIVGADKLPDELRYLLASHCDLVRVGRNGISFTLSGTTYRYKSEVTGALEGEWLKIYFDHEQPDVLLISNPKGEDIRFVPCDFSPPAFGATPDDLARASGPNSAHLRAAKARYSDLPSKFVPPARPMVIEPDVREKARKIKEARTEGRIRLLQNGSMRAEEAEVFGDPELDKFLRKRDVSHPEEIARREKEREEALNRLNDAMSKLSPMDLI
jgi:hypothetical protein